MKTLKTTIAILVLTIAANATFAQNSYYNAKNILESEIATHKCANTEASTSTLATVAAIKVCPMQIAEGVVVLKLANQPEGNYTVQIIDENGTVLMTTKVNHDMHSASETVKFGKTLAGGTYTVEVVRPDNSKKSETVMLLM